VFIAGFRNLQLDSSFSTTCFNSAAHRQDGQISQHYTYQNELGRTEDSYFPSNVSIFWKNVATTRN
jgi:hypothetical protein